MNTPPFIAIDCGTTNISLRLILPDNSPTGFHIAGGMDIANPNRLYGKDILTRINASISGKREALRADLTDALASAIASLLENSKLPVSKEIKSICLAGNTAVQNMLMGYDVTGLSRYPFTSETLFLSPDTALSLHNIPVTLLPCISAFVGGDITAGLAKYGFDKSEGINILLDIGTNGEIAIGTCHKILTAATAAGPAFENAVPGARAYGSLIIDAVSNALRTGAMDQTGLLSDAFFDKGFPYKGLTITQSAIREIQLAKAAIYTGICHLVTAYQTDFSHIGKVYLAGNFGYGLNIDAARDLMLIPPALCDKVTAVGNSSLDGAILYGLKGRKAFDKIIDISQTISLPETDGFGDSFINALNFCES